MPEVPDSIYKWALTGILTALTSAVFTLTVSAWNSFQGLQHEMLRLGEHSASLDLTIREASKNMQQINANLTQHELKIERLKDQIESLRRPHGTP